MRILIILLLCLSSKESFGTELLSCREFFAFKNTHASFLLETPRLRIDFLPREYKYLVYEKTSNLLVGTYQTNSINFEPWARAIGYATEAMFRILEFEFKNYNHSTLRIYAVTEASLALFKKLGFVPIPGESEGRVQLSYRQYLYLLANTKETFGEDLLSFANSSVSIKKDDSEVGRQIMSLVNRGDSKGVEDLLNQIPWRAPYQSAQPFREIYLDENRILFFDFVSKNSNLLGERKFWPIFAHGLAQMLRQSWTAHQSIDILLRYPPELQKKTYQSFERSTNIPGNGNVFRKNFLEVLQQVQRHGAWTGVRPRDAREKESKRKN